MLVAKMPIVVSTLVVMCALGGCERQETPVAASSAASPAQTAAPAMPAAPAAPANEAVPNPAAASDEVLSVRTAKGAVDCTGRHVEVFSEQADLTLTGACRGVFFLGANTRARIEQAERVQIVGDGVHVEVTQPLGEIRLLGNEARVRVGDVTGELYAQGDGNQVDVRSTQSIRLIGARNAIRWQSGQPSVNDFGSGNIVEPMQ